MSVSKLSISQIEKKYPIAPQLLQRISPTNITVPQLASFLADVKHLESLQQASLQTATLRNQTEKIESEAAKVEKEVQSRREAVEKMRALLQTHQQKITELQKLLQEAKIPSSN